MYIIHTHYLNFVQYLVFFSTAVSISHDLALQLTDRKRQQTDLTGYDIYIIIHIVKDDDIICVCICTYQNINFLYRVIKYPTMFWLVSKFLVSCTSSFIYLNPRLSQRKRKSNRECAVTLEGVLTSGRMYQNKNLYFLNNLFIYDLSSNKYSMW